MQRNYADILVSDEGVILAGYLRLQAIFRMGITRVPAIQISKDGTEKEIWIVKEMTDAA